MPDPSTPLTAREAAALDEVDEQRTRAEAAEAEADRLRKANKTIIGENHNVRAQLDRARDAARDGDWHGLWAALGLGNERLPEMHTALDTAMPVPAGWFDTAAELATETGLTAEQEIRVEALHAASRITIDAEGLTVRDLEQTIIGTAERYADWIATGSTESWDWQTQTYPEPQRWAWVGCEACRRGVCAGHPSPETKPATRHFSPNCACGINDAGERVVDPICARLSTEG